MSKVKATPALPSASHCQLPSRFTTASAPSLRGSNTWETNLINRNFATMRSGGTRKLEQDRHRRRPTATDAGGAAIPSSSEGDASWKAFLNRRNECKSRDE